MAALDDNIGGEYALELFVGDCAVFSRIGDAVGEFLCVTRCGDNVALNHLVRRNPNSRLSSDVAVRLKSVSWALPHNQPTSSVSLSVLSVKVPSSFSIRATRTGIWRNSSVSSARNNGSRRSGLASTAAMTY